MVSLIFATTALACHESADNDSTPTSKSVEDKNAIQTARAIYYEAYGGDADLEKDDSVVLTAQAVYFNAYDGGTAIAEFEEARDAIQTMQAGRDTKNRLTPTPELEVNMSAVATVQSAIFSFDYHRYKIAFNSIIETCEDISNGRRSQQDADVFKELYDALNAMHLNQIRSYMPYEINDAIYSILTEMERNAAEVGEANPNMDSQCETIFIWSKTIVTILNSIPSKN